MNKTFQSFVFGCRVNEAERIQIDRQLIEAGYSVDLASPTFLIINSCAITGKAEREARQLIFQLKKQYPEAKIVFTGCVATLWDKYSQNDTNLVDIIVPNDKKSSLVSLLEKINCAPLATASVARPNNDKFRHSNRLLVKIQDGCQRFCSYCIVPYLRGQPQSVRTVDIVQYINSFLPVPSEVVLSAINTEAFGRDTGESLEGLIQAVLKSTQVLRLALGSVHPWSLTEDFLKFYENTLSQEKRFVQFFHVPIQSGSQMVLNMMRREYSIHEVKNRLIQIAAISPSALIATDIIVGFLGETDKLFEETYSFLEKSPINKFHVFRFSNRPHTAAFFMKKRIDSMSLRSPLRRRIAICLHNEIATSPGAPRNDKECFEPTNEEKKVRSNRLIELSKIKYQKFIESQVGQTSRALIVAKHKQGLKVLLDNQVEGILKGKQYLPGSVVHVTIMSAKDCLVFCKES